MDCFVLLWLFDQRWLCGLKSQLHQHLLVGLIAFHGIAIMELLYRCQIGAKEIGWLTIEGTLLVLETLVYRRLLRKKEEVVAKATLINIDRIVQFTRELQARRMIWSKSGLFIFLLSLTLFSLQIVVWTGQPICRPICTMLNMASISYILVIVVCMIVVKLVYLLIAWRNSHFYLRYRGLH